MPSENTAITIAIISAVVSLASMALMLYKWLTGEKPRSDADAAGEITDTSMSLLKVVRAEMKTRDDQHAAELASMRLELNAMREENKLLREKLYRLEDVEDWAERLVFQIRSLPGNIEPVKIRVRNIVAKPQGQ